MSRVHPLHSVFSNDKAFAFSKRSTVLSSAWGKGKPSFPLCNDLRRRDAGSLGPIRLFLLRPVQFALRILHQSLIVQRFFFADISCTDRAACAFLGIRAICYGCAPYMPLRAEPPYSAASACCDLRWQQFSIERGMPLRCNLWIQCGKIIEACQYFCAGAIRALIGTNRAIDDSGSPLMSQRAAPPDNSVAACHDLFRRQWGVLLIIPFCGDQRTPRFQIVVAGLHGTTGADRTACCHASACYGCSLPFMPQCAAPPDFPAVAITDLLRR